MVSVNKHPGVGRGRCTLPLRSKNYGSHLATASGLGRNDSVFLAAAAALCYACLFLRKLSGPREAE